MELMIYVLLGYVAVLATYSVVLLRGKKCEFRLPPPPVFRPPPKPEEESVILMDDTRDQEILDELNEG